MKILLFIISIVKLYEINSDLQIENSDEIFWNITKLQRQFLSHEIIVNKNLK